MCFVYRFFIEKDLDGASTFIKNKLLFLQKNIEQVAQTIVAKRKSLETVNFFLTFSLSHSLCSFLYIIIYMLCVADQSLYM